MAVYNVQNILTNFVAYVVGVPRACKNYLPEYTYTAFVALAFL